MAVYQAVVKRSGERRATIGHIRRYTNESIARIRAALSDDEPVITIVSEEGPRDRDLVSSHALQHRKFADAVDGLLELGNVLEIRYRPSGADRYEIVTYEMMKNLMSSELASLADLLGR